MADNKDDPIDNIIKFFLKPIVFIEFLAVTYSIHGVEDWWGVALTLVIVSIVINVKLLYTVSFISLSCYVTYILSTGIYKNGGWGASITVGVISIVLLLSVHAYAFLDLEVKEIESIEKDESSEKENYEEAS